MIDEESIRSALAAIREIYIDADKGEAVARAIEEYMGTPTGKNRMQLEDSGVFVWDVNAIITSLTHDMHFGISRRFPGGSAANNDGGIARFTPHYIRLYKFDNASSEGVRDKYMRFFSQVQDPLVVDLRNCSGGDMETLYFFLCHFFPDGTPLYEEHTRLNPPKLMRAVSRFDAYEPHLELRKYAGRVKVIINSSSYSASEIFASVMQSRGRAKLYGTQTAGAGYATLDVQFGDIILHVPFNRPVDVARKGHHEGVGVTPDFTPSSREYIHTIFSDVYTEA